MDVRTATSPLLAELAAELDETVCVAVLLGTHVEFVAAAAPSGHPVINVPDGMILATHATAAGKALIADFQRADVERLYPTENLPRFTQKTLASRESLFRDLQRTRERGYAIHAQENDRNVTAYACAIRDLAGGARAAFVAVGTTQRFRRYSTSHVVAALQSAASTAMGFHTAAK